MKAPVDLVAPRTSGRHPFQTTTLFIAALLRQRFPSHGRDDGDSDEGGADIPAYSIDFTDGRISLAFFPSLEEEAQQRNSPDCCLSGLIVRIAHGM